MMKTKSVLAIFIILALTTTAFSVASINIEHKRAAKK